MTTTASNESKLLTKRVKGLVKFDHYTDGALWYRCEFDGFLFPVPLKDTSGDQFAPARFLRDDKAIYFMRWIRAAMAEGA